MAVSTTFDYKKYDASQDKDYTEAKAKADALINSGIQQSDNTKKWDATATDLINNGPTIGQDVKDAESAYKAMGTSYSDPNGYSKLQSDYAAKYAKNASTPFQYDLNGDALYQQYKDQYMRQGNIAMQDTMGQAAAMTGGYASTAATGAAQQTYQNYLTQLNDIIPTLRQMAEDRYNTQTQNYGNLASMYGNMYDQGRSAWSEDYNRAYNTYRDLYGDSYNNWNTQLSAAQNMLGNYMSQDATQWSTGVDYWGNTAENNRTFNYNKLQTENEQDMANWERLKEAEAAAAAASTGKSGGGGGGGGGGYTPSTRAKQIIESNPAPSSNTSKNAYRSHIADEYDKGRISAEDAEYLYKYYGIIRK